MTYIWILAVLTAILGEEEGEKQARGIDVGHGIMVYRHFMGMSVEC